MPIIGETTIVASYNGVKVSLNALVARRLTHDMIISWRDCIRFNIIPNTTEQRQHQQHPNKSRSDKTSYIQQTRNPQGTNSVRITLHHTSKNNTAKGTGQTIQIVNYKTPQVRSQSRSPHRRAHKQRQNNKSSRT